ncbi:MAG: zinc-dependent metalloprotease [Candidatus Nanopelagicales bacterium]
MSNVPFGFSPQDPDEQGNPQNPFDMANLGSALSQLGAMLQGMSTDASPGAVNWSAASDVARRTIAANGDPVVADAQSRAVTEAVRLADLWLDPATEFPSTGAGARAWSRSQWLEATMPAWQEIITPIAEQVQASMGSMMPSTEDLAGGLPEELRAMLPADLPVDLGAMLGPMMGMARQMGANMFAMQAGQGLAGLAGEVLGAGDVGQPLTADGVPTLVPENVATFGGGLGIEPGEIALYLALREVAHQRLFAHVHWLSPTVRGAVAEYARGIGLDMGAMEQAMREIDMTNPANIQEALSSGVLAPQDTPEQKAALARLETLLALVEGWVDHVVSAAIGDRLPTAGRLQEAVRRRRAAGGPAEKTFQTLVGLEMRPRRLREAAALWAELEKVRGVTGRDAVWAHPDLLPSAADLDDPSAFVSGSSISDADLAALASGEFAGGAADDGAAPTDADDQAAPAGADDSDESSDDGSGSDHSGSDDTGAESARADDSGAGEASAEDDTRG